jgi:hypothetical protein
MRVIRLFLALAIATAGFADTITLKNGQVIEGTFLGGTARQVRVDLGDQVQNIEIADIARIEFGGPPSTPPPPPPPAPPPPPPPQDVQPPAPQQLGITLPAGTNFTIRMIDSVDSQKAKTGDTFAASLDSPVTDPANGNIVIPRGADVVVKLVDSKQSGKIAGRTELALALMSVRVNGQLAEINSQTISEKSSDRAGRSAGTIGGGAVGGAVLGGILGGGKGAAIGLGAGAAGGTAVELATKGQRVKVPSETRLTFVLDNAVRI